MKTIEPISASAAHTPRPQQRMNGRERRQLILETAMRILANRGFEGFRTHDVAQQAGITNATLLYYFPTKDGLIAGVAEHLEELYAKHKAPAITERAGESPTLRALRQEVADARFLHRHKPEMLAVSREFALRANRDGQLRALIDRLTVEWQTQIEGILRSGKREGVIRADLDPAMGARVIVSALWGASALLDISDNEFQQFGDQLLNWVTTTHRKRR